MQSGKPISSAREAIAAAALTSNESDDRHPVLVSGEVDKEVAEKLFHKEMPHLDLVGRLTPRLHDLRQGEPDQQRVEPRIDPVLKVRLLDLVRKEPHLVIKAGASILIST